MSHRNWNINFGGDVIKTTLTTRAEEVIDWINSVNRQRRSYEEIVVGLDIEWRPNVIRGITNKTAILQLCVGTKCLIIQLFYIDYIPRSLTTFMRDPNNKFVGVEVDRDVAKLNTDYGLDCFNTADVRDLAISQYRYLFSNPRPGLKEIALQILGVTMLKPLEVTRSDWQRRILTFSQVEYATIDAYASYALGCKLIREGTQSRDSDRDSDPESDPDSRSRSPYRSPSPSPYRSPYRSRPPYRSRSPDRSPYRSPDQSPYRSRSPYRSPYRAPYRSPSPYRSPDRSPSPYRSPDRSPYRSPYRSPDRSPYCSPYRFPDRSRSPSPYRSRSRSPYRSRSRSPSPSPSPYRYR